MAGLEVDDRANRRELGSDCVVGLREPGGFSAGSPFYGAELANKHRLAGRQAPLVEGPKICAKDLQRARANSGAQL